MAARPPIVTIMGHVDHGKTTLLDALRKTNVVAQEFGGITQHIGAFSGCKKITSNNVITFLDTPGHAAFSSMRARGAMVTDIVVLVVAADDGVMKQTLESLRFARDANVPIIVAINKIDKPNIDLASTKRSLLNSGIQLEEFGGDVQLVLISALKGLNLDKLQECILAQAEMMDLKADPTCHVQAVCIESRTDPGRGKLSTLLIQQGSLKRGDILVGGSAWAKVRGMFNDQGKPVEKAEPGQPVEVIGWRTLAPAGQNIIQVDCEQDAKKLIEKYSEEENEKKINMDNEVIQKKMELHREFYNELRKKKLELGRRMGSIYRAGRSKESQTDNGVPKLDIIIKGDVDGSVEAILDVVETYSCSDQCKLNVINYGVGAVTENDVQMAQMFDGIIYTFNIETPDSILSLAKEQGVKILNYNIIYRLFADLIKQLNNKLPEIEDEEVIGEANVLANFSVTEGKKKVWVAGCRCVKGQLVKKKQFKLVRNGQTILEGSLGSLKHFKNEVDSIKTDTECGLSFDDQQECPCAGDRIVCYDKVGKKQNIKWNLDFI
ncbi:hypothetical protein HELRODRAFT_110518 [Helobdella robusta]|uniref:Translation initiation factor IF-2, mitochondrial n=1 Tax=Helobdella robusta TaxID=6412 RepID=T1EF30_HELRO|nr:hypothetical protein HELRODRAFT_110518 [Helobdella robusta]ESO07647.1 hypothetical protein HELRODRAFT_110518 [Helobdella robusta]